MEGSRLTPEAICSGLRMIQAGYERQDEDFNIVFAEGEYGKGQHRIEVSFCRLLSEAVELLKEQQPKTGHWKRTGRKNVYGGIEIVCSVCDNHVIVKNVDDELFCRHCGAEMTK